MKTKNGRPVITPAKYDDLEHLALSCVLSMDVIHREVAELRRMLNRLKRLLPEPSPSADERTQDLMARLLPPDLMTRVLPPSDEKPQP